jgi:cell fate (sporulation/competence/biofilm development) regulator YlbF (YheA/YmcA/DUF963 family)
MRRILLLALMAAVLSGCDSPQTTIDQLRAEIASYKEVPSDSAQTKIEVDFTKLEAQIEKLQDQGMTAEAASYRARAENLRADYRAARMVTSMKNAQTAIEGLGHAFKEAGKSIGDAFRDPSKPSPTPK